MESRGFDLPDLLRLIYDRLICPLIAAAWARPAATGTSPGCVTHRFKFRVEDARAARYFGAFEGGWVFLTIGRHGHTLLNLLTDSSFRLPKLFFEGNGLHIPLVILAATLSSPPVDGHSVIGAIISSRRRFDGTERQLAFWRLGQCDYT
ncbi:hypothetical protein E2562_029263 [Oryza meyeriana var. granulata]|uniref:KIB1-4 beta-propeller domain-containing protein n=1 Tax=Oryza meyeriana var. granulata TaxID=110450 RepID=A0A6G1ER42_9ORYZ|nr:hypothetical protein E2562_029263 [Oryza meyeriana var. granulata]